MKTATMLAAVFLTSFTFNAQAKESLDVSRYTIDREDSNIGFEVAHLMISTVSGRFDAFNGTIGYNAATDTVTSIQGVAKAASINTNQTKRDKHLRSADFLDVDKYPELTFAADQLFVKKGRTAPAKGKLTIRGVTKEIPFNVEFKGKVKDPWGTEKLVVEAQTTINRKDFGLTWNEALETGGVMVGDQVKITVTAQGKKQE